MSVLDEVAPERRGLWAVALKVAFDPHEHPRGGHPDNAGEFSRGVGPRGRRPRDAQEPRRETSGGPGGGTSPIFSGPRTSPQDVARGDVYEKPLPKGKYEEGDPRNDPEFDERHHQVTALLDTYTGMDLPTILHQINDARAKGKPLSPQEIAGKIRLYKQHREQMDRGLGGASDELYDKLERVTADPATGKSSSKVTRDLYSPERTTLHNQIIDKVVNDAIARGVPRDHRAIIMGGPSGAGKSSLLKAQAGSLGLKGDPEHPDNYVVINPDLLKEPLLDAMDRSGDAHRYQGLGRNEMGGLVHEESSHLSKMLARRLMSMGFNVVHDVTLADEKKAYGKYVAPYPDYDVTHVMVDGPIERSRHNAGLRYKFADPTKDAKRNWGGRFVDMDVVDSQQPRTPGYRSKNAEETEKFVHRPEVKHAVVYDPLTKKATWVKREGQLVDPNFTLNHSATVLRPAPSAEVPVQRAAAMTESKIHAQIQAFRAGQVDRAGLIDFLTSYPYSDNHEPHIGGHKERYWHTEGGRETVPDSWDEVNDAHADGSLPRDVYMEVVSRLHRA